LLIDEVSTWMSKQSEKVLAAAPPPLRKLKIPIQVQTVEVEASIDTGDPPSLDDHSTYDALLSHHIPMIVSAALLENFPDIQLPESFEMEFWKNTFLKLKPSWSSQGFCCLVTTWDNNRTEVYAGFRRGKFLSGLSGITTEVILSSDRAGLIGPLIVQTHGLGPMGIPIRSTRVGKSGGGEIPPPTTTSKKPPKQEKKTSASVEPGPAPKEVKADQVSKARVSFAKTVDRQGNSPAESGSTKKGSSSGGSGTVAKATGGVAHQKAGQPQSTTGPKKKPWVPTGQAGSRPKKTVNPSALIPVKVRRNGVEVEELFTSQTVARALENQRRADRDSVGKRNGKN